VRCCASPARGSTAAPAPGSGRSIAQKNTAELGTAGRALGFDFAIAEECQAYGECGTYMKAYGNEVFEVEYPDNGGIVGFRAACGTKGYINESC
jgi:hypothetical protein